MSARFRVARRLAGARRTATLACTGALLLSGCSDAGPTAPPAPGASAARVLLGTGEQRYVPIEGEPVLPLVAGIQGGFHVWATFLGYGYQGDRLTMRVTTRWGPRDEHTFPWVTASIRVREVVDEQGEPALEGRGWPAQVELPRCAHGQRIEIEMSVSDDFGAEASDQRAFFADVAEGQRATDCPAP